MAPYSDSCFKVLDFASYTEQFWMLERFVRARNIRSMVHQLSSL